MRVLVCGGRGMNDPTDAFRALDKLHALRGITLLIHDGCAAAVTWAEDMAEGGDCIPLARYAPAWDGDDHQQRMVDQGKAEGALVLPGGEDVARRAEAAGIKAWRPT